MSPMSSTDATHPMVPGFDANLPTVPDHGEIEQTPNAATTEAMAGLLAHAASRLGILARRIGAGRFDGGLVDELEQVAAAVLATTVSLEVTAELDLDDDERADLLMMADNLPIHVVVADHRAGVIGEALAITADGVSEVAQSTAEALTGSDPTSAVAVAFG